MKRFFIAIISSLLMTTGAWAAIPEGDLLSGVRPGADGKIDVVTVFAHPDDESFYVGGTLIKLKQDPRVRLHVLCLTIGDKDRAGKRLGISPAELGRIRVEELRAAANVMNADSAEDLGYPDQGLASADYPTLVARILEVLQKYGAELVITHDPYGISGHPDHVTCSRAAGEAFKQSGAQKLFWVTMPPVRYAVNALFSVARPDALHARPTLQVNIAAQKRLKDLALHSHASQARFSFWNALAMKEDLLYHHEFFCPADSK